MTLVLLLVMFAFSKRRALAATLLTLVPLEAHAYVCSRVGPNVGPSLIWDTRTIPWYADEALFDIFDDRTLAEEDLRASFAAWEDVPCSDLSFPLAAVIPGLSAGYDESGENRNVVVQIRNGWPYDKGAIAVTTSAYDTRTGVVQDADIEINAQEFEFIRVDSSCNTKDGTMDLRNTITHEVGHVLGLDHPPSSPRYAETTMFASAPPCETRKQTLHEDDIEGLCSIYPAGNPTQQCYPPDGPSFTQVDSDDGFGCSNAGGGSPFVLLLLPLIFTRRGSPSSAGGARRG